jgi:Phosphatidyl serine synthase
MLGAWTCNYLYMRELHWIYTKPHEQLAPCKSKVQTLINKFKPNVWTRYDWSIFGSVKRYNQILFFCVFCLGIDCMNFFLKFILWVPADHKILAVRVFMWAFGSIACAKEYYEFISNKYCKRVGPYVWVNSLSLGVELSIVIKFGSTMFTSPFPWYV